MHLSHIHPKNVPIAASMNIIPWNGVQEFNQTLIVWGDIKEVKYMDSDINDESGLCKHFCSFARNEPKCTARCAFSDSIKINKDIFSFANFDCLKARKKCNHDQYAYIKADFGKYIEINSKLDVKAIALPLVHSSAYSLYIKLEFPSIRPRSIHIDSECIIKKILSYKFNVTNCAVLTHPREITPYSMAYESYHSSKLIQIIKLK